MHHMKFDLPTSGYPHKIPRRLNILSVPKRIPPDPFDSLPALTDNGVRKSALKAHINDRVVEASWPYLRRLLITKRMYKNRWPKKRLEVLDRTIESANATIFAKLANCAIDLKKQEGDKLKKKRGWSDSEWKKHMEYISQIAVPKKEPKPLPVKRGPNKPLDQLVPRIRRLAYMPEGKMYKRLSQEEWYRDPTKVSPLALKYVLSEHTKKLAEPKKAQEW